MAREEISETAENMKSIAVNEDSHDNQRYDKTKERPQNSFRAALQVTIITDPAEAQASEIRESNRESREKDGLEVARKALEAAKDSAFYALIGVITSLAGFCTLIWTLLETNHTNRIAAQSLEIAVRGNRPHLVPVNGRLIRENSEAVTLQVWFDVTNYGGLGLLRGRKIDLQIATTVYPGGYHTLLRPIPADDVVNFRASMASFSFEINEKPLKLISHEATIRVTGYLDYTDSFDTTWRTHFEFGYAHGAVEMENLYWVDSGYRDEKIKDG